MTDEMTIQQHRLSPYPYLLGGATIGAGAGLGVNQWTNFTKGTPMSHEDVIAEVNSKDKFEARVKEGAPDVSSWQDVKSKADAVTAAEKELADAQKAKLPDTAKEATDLANAKNAYEAKITELKNLETQRLRNSGSGIPATSATPLEFDKLNITGNAAERTRLQNEYNNLKNSYDAAVRRIDSTINSGIGATRAARESSITSYLNNEYITYSTKTEEELAELFSKKTERNAMTFWATERPTAQYQRALNEAGTHYPDFTRSSLKGEHYLQFGQQIERGTVVPPEYRATTITITDPVTHRPKHVGVMYKETDLQNFVTNEAKRVSEQRIAYADQLFNNARESVLLKQKLHNLPTTYSATVEKGLANSTGLYTAATPTSSEMFNFGQILTESSNTRNSIPSRRGTTTLTGFDADIKSLKDALNDARRTGTTATMPPVLNGAYSTTDVQKALDMAHARKAVATGYSKQSEALIKEIKQCITSNSVIADLDAQIAAIRANDAGLQKAKEKFVQKFPEVFGKGNAVATMSEAEILAKAQEYAEKNVSQSLKDDIAKFQQLYDDAAKKAGVVDEAAVKAATSKVESAKGELEKAAKALGEKYTKGGKAKWIAPVIGAVALGLGALAFRPGAKEA